MSRRSSSGVRPTAALGGPVADPIRAAEFLGFEPTDAQLRVRSAFWVAYREDPTVDLDHLGPSEIARRVDAPSIAKWWVDPHFRAWFLNREEWRTQIEFAFELWLTQVVTRLRSRTVADRELLGYGKMLAEMGRKLPSGTAADGDGDGSTKATPDEMRRLIHEAALQLGYTPPLVAALDAAPASDKEIAE
jgi:hypothetical protein